MNFSRTTAERLTLVALTCLAAILQSALTDRGKTLAVALAAVLAALAADALGNLLRKRTPLIHDAGALVTALVLTLLLPNTINPALAAISAFFAVAVVRDSFGGFGANWLNPAAGGWLFAVFAWPLAGGTAADATPLAFLSHVFSHGGGTEFNPVTLLTQNGFGAGNGAVLTTFVNRYIFSLLNIELPANYIDFFINPGNGIIADRGVFGLLLGSMALVATAACRYVWAFIYLAVYLLLVRVWGALPLGGPLGAGDMLYCLFSGGTLAAAFILARDPVTGAKSKRGMFIAACALAFLSFFFRYSKGAGEGALAAVVCVNALTPLIRRFEERIYERGIGVHHKIVISITRSEE